ncbi:MAG: TIGR04283 family arsenosugar biosynthesis glycosyltransferase [Nitrospinota bacterium]
MLISIILPVLNEATTIEETLDALDGLEGEREVIVVDGGSADGTAELAAPRARVLRAPRGRARQMNAGARAARGEALLFLHSDTRLPPGALRLVAEALRDPACVGGGFRHRFDREGAYLRFTSRLANWRARFLGLFFGDQGQFARREVFEQVGGFPDVPLFEDWELSRKLRARGKLVLLPEAVLTSARRVERWGMGRALLTWYGLGCLYLLGVPPERLARFYGDIR